MTIDPNETVSLGKQAAVLAMAGFLFMILLALVGSRNLDHASVTTLEVTATASGQDRSEGRPR